MILESTTLAREIMRRAKLTRFAHRIRMLWHRSEYEDRFSDVLLASIQPDDCVWDIGANIGFYTERFSKLARHVVAFEPVVENCRQIESKRMANVDCLAVALGDGFPSLPHPTIIKIDVEGYEVEVIRGMYGILGDVRALFVEIHFQILAERGMRQAPAALVKDLKRLGFSRIEWPDASHIAAFRT